MRKRISILLILVFSLMPVLSSCGHRTEGGGAAVSSDGFKAMDLAEGGGTLMDANVASVSCALDGDDAVITLGFLAGSRMSGGADERTPRNVPRYKAYMLSDPARLVIEFASIRYWDYEREMDLSAAPFIEGCFRHTPTGGLMTALYFQLDGKAEFNASSDADKLTVRVHPLPAQPVDSQTNAPAVGAGVDVTIGDEMAPEGSAYYVVANAYRDFASGILPSDIDLTPALASDLETVLLISKGCRSREEAEKLMASTLNHAPGAVKANWSVALLGEGELPEYYEAMDYMAAYDEKVMRVDGAETTAEVFLPDGYFLSVTPGRDGCLYAKQRMSKGFGDDAYAYQQLYIRYEDGTVKRFLTFEFGTIESASYSPDGRRLAVLERAGESTHLYIFDVDTKELVTDLTTMGLGDTVSAFTWDSMGSIIYSIGGSGEVVVHQYDFNVPTVANRHSIVDKKGADEGSIGFADGEVFFVESALDTGGVIYRIKPDGGVRRKFLSGSAFSFTNDARYMAYASSAGDATGGQSACAFSIYDMASGESKLVTSDFAVNAFIWSHNGERLYYFENRLSGGLNEGEGGDASDAETAEDAYPYTLWMYDVTTGASRAIADLPYTSISVSDEADRVYLRYYDAATMGNVVRATYVIYTDGSH